MENPIKKTPLGLNFVMAITAMTLSVPQVFGATDIVEKLVGTANTHLGPNCHNATLVAKGYEDLVTTTSADEINFYLKNFCRPSQDPAISGDVITVISNQYADLVHTMFSLGNGKIFEKESADGLFHSSSRMNPYYQIKKFEDSWYFVNRVKNDYRFIVYNCPDAETVRQKLKTCEMRAEEIGLKAIRREFQKMSFSASREYTLSSEALAKMQIIATAIEQIKRPDPCLGYFKVIVKSIWVSVYALEAAGGETTDKAWLQFPQRNEWLKAANSLESSVSDAEAKVRYFETTGRDPL